MDSVVKKKIEKAGIIVRAEAREMKGILGKIRRRDFKGNAGQAIKNSSYQMATLIFAKISSFLLTIIIARMLLPELFGLYSLALGTFALFGGISELGINVTLTTFISKLIWKKKLHKAKSYFVTLGRFRLKVTLIVTAIFLAISYFIALYYNKPIFFILLMGGLYIPIVSLTNFLEQSFRASNNFKIPFIKEIYFQFSRFALVPITALIAIKYLISKQLIVLIILFVIIISHIITILYLLRKIKKLPFSKSKISKLNKEEKLKLRKFAYPIAVMGLSGVFFGYIDMIMLGHFVQTSFIAFYSAAFSLIGSLAVILSFSSASLFPIFTTLKKKALKRGFRKGASITFLIAILAVILTYSLAFIIINITYGKTYLDAVVLLKLLSPLLILIPLINLHNTYYISQGRTKTLAKLLIASTILNIIFNYFFITQGLQISMLAAVRGACIATVLSKTIHLGGLFILKNRRKKISID